MDMLADRRLLATLSAFSLITLGAGLAKMLGEGNKCKQEQQNIDVSAQERQIHQ